jgi:hypothetical protein
MKNYLFIKTVVYKFILPILRIFICRVMESLYGLFRSSVAVIVLVYFYIYVHCTNILFLKSHAVLITKNYACIYTTSSLLSVYLQCIPLLHSCVWGGRISVSQGDICVLVNMYTVQPSPVFLSTQFTIITLLNIPDRLNFEICCS